MPTSPAPLVEHLDVVEQVRLVDRLGRRGRLHHGRRGLRGRPDLLTAVRREPQSVCGSLLVEVEWSP